MKIALCDDCKEFLDSGRKMIENWDKFENNVSVELFEDGDALIRAHTETPFDIIFLDIVMPLLNGIDAAKEIRQQDKTVKIVFLTSSPEFAIESYSVKASNYLLKPFDKVKFYACLDELCEEMRQKARSIIVKSGTTVHRVEIGEIEYLEAQNKNVKIVLSDGKNILSVEPLYAFEEKLIPGGEFFKCSRSYIVNIHRIGSFNQKEITMHSGSKIPVSRGCHKQFEEAYFAEMFGKAGEK